MAEPINIATRLEDLLETLTRRSEEECRAIRSAAVEEARILAGKAKEEVQAHVDARLAAEEAALEAHLRKSREQAKTRVTLDADAMRQQVSEEVMERAAAELARIAASPEFGPMLTVLLAEATAAVDHVAEVLAPPAHVDGCREWLAGQGMAGVKVTADARLHDGVVAVDQGGGYRVTNTLSRRFERMSGDARKLCMEGLFGDNDT